MKQRLVVELVSESLPGSMLAPGGGPETRHAWAVFLQPCGAERSLLEGIALRFHEEPPPRFKVGAEFILNFDVGLTAVEP